MGTAFERLINQQVKVVYKDGNELRVKRGLLVSVSDGFVTLETVHGACAIKVSEIIKIQTAPHVGSE